MEIILSNHCKSLTGSLGQGFGYFIVNRKGRFYSVRSKHSVPHDGHWRFILTCADLAQNGLHISDIRRLRVTGYGKSRSHERLFFLPFFYGTERGKMHNEMFEKGQVCQME